MDFSYVDLSPAAKGASICADLGPAGAYLYDGAECKYSFEETSTFNGIAGETSEQGDVDYVGFTLKMKSKQACGGGTFDVTINAYCADT